MKPAIRVENLSKQYRIGTRTRGASRNLTESIVDGASALWRSLTGRTRGSDGANEFWALKDVSFEVQPGEVVGIIGRNGAGKSTLLKILSRIAEPTSGRAEVRGRMASLLEVGTGFHPELTGRENIYLNGSVLGMSRQEINRKFDEIVAFSDIEKFLDTAVKRYSSGMYVRLAFAVAAHLEPENLIVDEVLAVGDAEFQKKCLGKIGEVSKGGRTVLFVSHNMATIETLTNRCMALQEGRVVFIGGTADAVSYYLASGNTNAADLDTAVGRRGTMQVRILSIRLSDREGHTCTSFRPGQPISIAFHVRSECDQSWDLAFAIETASGVPIFASHLTDCLPAQNFRGERTFVVELTPNQLRQGMYSISTGIYSTNINTIHDEVCHLTLFEIAGTAEGFPNDKRWGLIFLPLTWGSR